MDDSSHGSDSGLADFEKLIKELRESGKNSISFSPNPTEGEPLLATMLREYAIFALRTEGETINEYGSITVTFDWSEKDFGMDFIFWPKPTPYDPPDHIREEVLEMVAAGIKTVTFPTTPPVEKEPEYIVWLRKTAISMLTKAGIDLMRYRRLQALFFQGKQEVGFYPLDEENDNDITQTNSYLQ